GLYSTVTYSPGTSLTTIQAKAPIKGNSIIVLAMLKPPCQKAIVIWGFKLSCVCKNSTKLINGFNNNKNMDAPSKLNITWVKAALLAVTDAPSAASIAVIVVPKLSPNKTGIAEFKVIEPTQYTPSKIPIVALEL